MALSSISGLKSEFARRAVVVGFDRLHTGFLGCCGNDWIETPHFDRMATETVVFDQHFCDNLDSAAANHAWWTGVLQFPLDESQQRQCPSFVDALNAQGVRTCLVVESDGRDDTAVAPQFGEVLSVLGDDGFDVSESETPFARVVKRCGDWLQESARQEGEALLWIKSRGIPVPWVPPKAFAELYLDEFGLAEEQAAELVPDQEAGATARTSAEEDVPQVDRDASLDWRYAAAMYAAYTTLLDRWLGKLMTIIRESPGWEDALLIVTAAAGQTLGEHGSLEDETLPLRSESAQTPLWVRVPGSDQAGTRRQCLVQSVDLAPTLLEWFCGPGAHVSLQEQPDQLAAGKSLLPLIRNEPLVQREFVILGNGRSEWGIRTSDFFYVEPGDRMPESDHTPAQLFEKPHDRWDQSDVLSQYPQVSEELQSTLRREVERLTACSPGFSRLPDNGK